MNGVLLIVVPLRGWRRELTVLDLNGCTEAEAFTTFRVVNEVYTDMDMRHAVDITLAPIGVSQLTRWIDNNVDLNWWESLWGRVRYSLFRV